jgi:hypothetical protein
MTRIASFFALLLLLTGCSSPKQAQVHVVYEPPVAPAASQTPTINSYAPDAPDDQVGELVETFTENKTLSLNAYEMAKLTRPYQVRSGKTLDIDYAVLRSHGRTIARFDSIDDPISEIRFGLFSFLGGGDQQFVVEQTSNKWWRYWIVSLEPRFKIVYDSGPYPTAYELRVADLDHDGQMEILQNLGTFWYFDALNNVNSPRPQVIFKYDSRLGTYQPSNPRFSEVTLRDIDARGANVQQILARQEDPFWHRQNVLCSVLDVTIRYLYSGKNSEAWAFFEQYYPFEDKKEVRSEIANALRKDRYYQAIAGRLIPKFQRTGTHPPSPIHR